MAALNYTKTTLYDMITAVINDVEAGKREGSAHQHIMGDLGRGLTNSRLIPAWHPSIDVALKKLITEMVQQAVDIADVVVITSTIVNLLLDRGADKTSIIKVIRARVIETTGIDCGLLTALRALDFVEWKRE